MLLDASHVLTQTKHLAGPDGLPGRVMKVCADQLGPFFTSFFPIAFNSKVHTLNVKGALTANTENQEV